MAESTVVVSDLASHVIGQVAMLEAFAALPAETLARAYAPGKWTGVELFAHLADTELVFVYRFLKAIAEPGSPIVPFEQDAWVARLEGAARPVSLSLAMIRTARAVMAHHLVAVPEDRLQTPSLHPEKGPLTPIAMAELMRRHMAHHITQLAAIRDGRVWTAK